MSNFLLDKANKLETMSPDTICSFSPERADHVDTDITTEPALGIDDGISTAVIASTSVNNMLVFRPWVNQVNVVVHTKDLISRGCSPDAADSLPATAAGNRDAAV